MRKAVVVLVLMSLSGCGMSVGQIRETSEEYVWKGKVVAQKGADALGEIIKHVVNAGIMVFDVGKRAVEGLKDSGSEN